MRHVDVLIVGGGPGGSSCAFGLRRRGIDCLVLDRDTFPRTKLCGGLVTQAAARALGLLPADYPHGWLWIDRFDFHFRRFTLPLPSPQISIRRCEFDAFLLARSAVEVIPHRVRSIERRHGRYVVDGTFSCDVLVGAGGTSCPVHRTFFRDRSRHERSRQITVLEEEFPHEVRDRRCHFWFFDDGFPGYYWYIPKADGWINIGVGALAEPLKAKQDSIWRHFERLVERLRRRGLLAAGERRPGGYTYYLRADGPAPARDGIYLVGDAAGLATVDLGEGIGPAIESGLAAAEAIATGKAYRLDHIPRRSATNLALDLVRRRWLARRG